MKVKEIEQFAHDYVLPNDIKLNQASTVRDTEKYFDSHIAVLKGKTSRRIKMLHYNRLMHVIEIIKSKGLVRKDGLEEEVVEKTVEIEVGTVEIEKELKNDNTLDMPESIETESAIKPNDDFDSAKPMKPNTSFDDEKPVERKMPPEPNKIVEQDEPKKEEPPEFTQGSLF